MEKCLLYRRGKKRSCHNTSKELDKKGLQRTVVPDILGEKRKHTFWLSLLAFRRMSSPGAAKEGGG